MSIKNAVGLCTSSATADTILCTVFPRLRESLFAFASKLGRRNYWPGIILRISYHFVHVRRRKKKISETITTTVRDGLISTNLLGRDFANDNRIMILNYVQMFDGIRVRWRWIRTAAIDVGLHAQSDQRGFVGTSTRKTHQIYKIPNTVWVPYSRRIGGRKRVCVTRKYIIFSYYGVLSTIH